MDFDDGNFGGDEKAFDVDVKFAVGRKCTSFVLDVATEMFESSPSGEPYVKEALKRIRKYLNHLALSASLTEYAAVLLMNAVSEPFSNSCSGKLQVAACRRRNQWRPPAQQAANAADGKCDC